MKISNSKKQLAKIIHENGGWRDGAEFAAQDKDGEVIFYATKPTKRKESEVWNHSGVLGGDWIECERALQNWHQTILSREEYFHLYPAPDADGWIEYNGHGSPYSNEVVVEAKWSDGGFTCSDNFGPGCAWLVNDCEPNITHHRLHKPEQAGATDKLSSEAVSAAKIALMSDSIEELVRKPTIEQLAADYRNRKDYADRKQQEADAAKADADAKLAAYVAAAGSAVGLVLSVGVAVPELVITDWRDLQVGDEVECVAQPFGAECQPGMEGVVTRVLDDGVYAKFAGAVRDGRDEWFSTKGAAFTFIRRPANGADNA